MTRPTYDRWYAARLPTGLSDNVAQTIWAAANVWAARCDALFRHARLLPLYADLTPANDCPTFTVGPVVRLDATTIEIPIGGGPTTYDWLKVFEDKVPDFLHNQLRAKDSVDLQTSRRDERGFFPHHHWIRLVPEETAHSLRASASWPILASVVGVNWQTL
jgi:hypothetical protein